MRLIDADALEEQLCDKAKEMLGIAEQCKGTAINYYTGTKYGFSKSALIANDLPTIDPVKHGTWKLLPSEVVSDDGLWGETRYVCSNCGKQRHFPYPYCPICGAKMDCK